MGKYTAPLGGDAADPYIDANPAAGIEGSAVPAAALEWPQRELDHLIRAAGLTPDAADLTQVRQAVQALSPAVGLLPIYPTIETEGHTLSVTTIGGAVMVEAGQTWVWRGIQRHSSDAYTEAQRAFATVASKTYHLRWDRGNGFRLRDLSDAGYNPGAKTEDSPVFDSTYDDMLVARVVTTASNVAVITPLTNAASLYARSADMPVIAVTGPGDGGPARVSSATGSESWVNIRFEGLNWARKPTVALVQGAQLNFSSSEMNYCMIPALKTRYRALGTYSGSPSFVAGDGIYVSVECVA